MPDAPPAVLVAVSHDGGARWLVRVAPVSLRPLPGRRLRLEAPLEAWALSADNRLLAGVGDRARVLRLIDVERMRALGRLRTLARGWPAAVVWPRPGRLGIVLHTDSSSPDHNSRANVRASSRSVFARACVMPVSSGLTTTTRR